MRVDMRRPLALLACAVLACAPPLTRAAGFAAAVMPPRFELTATPGQTLRDVLVIGNQGADTSTFDVYTADWKLEANGGVTLFYPDLQPGSCRPWTRIESHSVTLDAGEQRHYRFEVHVPPDAVPGECRFAIVFQPPARASRNAQGGINLPLQARLAVIVYVIVGDAAPRLEFKGLSMAEVNKRRIPVVTLHNAGNAHGRPQGLLKGVDADGAVHAFYVSPSPILPGQTRIIPIWPEQDAQGNPIVVKTPLHLQGDIEWRGGKHAVDVTLR